MSTIDKIRSFDPSSVVAKPGGYNENKIRSGPGALGEFMRRKVQVEKENVELRAALDDHNCTNLLITVEEINSTTPHNSGSFVQFLERDSADFLENKRLRDALKIKLISVSKTA